MSFMNAEITRKGTLVTADCRKCGSSMFAHEWSTWGFNEAREEMEAGTATCPHCAIGKTDAETFRDMGRGWYAGRYSASGYMDCTDWNYGRNLRKLERELRDMYGDD